MKRTLFALAVLLLALEWRDMSQLRATAAAPVQAPAFEVAAIRQVLRTDQTLNEVLSGSRRVTMTVTDTRVMITYMSLAELLRRAFRLEPYQLSGPEWLSELRFDIQATIPPGATRDQVPEMLQRLLTSRFGLVTHREFRERPVFWLVVGKDGPKMQEAAPEADATSAALPPTETPPGSVGTQSGGAPKGRGDFVLTTKTETSTMTFRYGQNGSVQVDVSRMTMGELAQTLTGFVGRPVFDGTKLTGAYKLILEVAGAEAARMVSSGRSATSSSLRGDALQAATPANLATEPLGQSSIVRSVERLGLELQEGRMPIEVTIVDKISRTATPN
jgi:uncharacterized protein (TIGR03435 family)